MPAYKRSFFFFFGSFFLEFKLVYLCDISSAYMKVLSKILRGDAILEENAILKETLNGLF